MLYHLWVVGTPCRPFLDFVEFFVDLFIWRAKCCTVWTSGPLQQSSANFSRIGLHILLRIVIAILFPLLILTRRQLCSAFLHCLALLSRFYVSLLVARCSLLLYWVSSTTPGFSFQLAWVPLPRPPTPHHGIVQHLMLLLLIFLINSKSPQFCPSEFLLLFLARAANSQWAKVANWFLPSINLRLWEHSESHD